MVKTVPIPYPKTQETEANTSPAEMEKKGGDAGDFPGEKNPEPAVISDHHKAAVDLFYEKVAKLNESSGLSLVFNFRETMLDLHRFHQEVIKRGGFYQVTKMGKWDDVASASRLKSSASMSAVQLQNIYEMLVLQYELMYCHKMPDPANIWPDQSSQGFQCSWANLSHSSGKRKHSDSSCLFVKPLPGDRDGPAAKREHRDDKYLVAKGGKIVEKYSSMIASPKSNDKENIIDSDGPLKPRTGYQIFLRLETSRLKMVHGERSDSQNLRDMATAVWRSLPEKDKLPFMEASKMDKERYEKEMVAYYKQAQGKQNVKQKSLFRKTSPSMLNFSETEDVYHVSLEDDTLTSHSPDESMVKLAIEAMKNAKSNDSIFQIDLDNTPS